MDYFDLAQSFKTTGEVQSILVKVGATRFRTIVAGLSDEQAAVVSRAFGLKMKNVGVHNFVTIHTFDGDVSREQIAEAIA